MIALLLIALPLVLSAAILYWRRKRRWKQCGTLVDLAAFQRGITSEETGIRIDSFEMRVYPNEKPTHLRKLSTHFVCRDGGIYPADQP